MNINNRREIVFLPYKDNDDVTALEAARELKMEEMVACIQGLMDQIERAKGAKWVEKMKKEAAVSGHVRKIRCEMNCVFECECMPADRYLLLMECSMA